MAVSEASSREAARSAASTGASGAWLAVGGPLYAASSITSLLEGVGTGCSCETHELAGSRSPRNGLIFDATCAAPLRRGCKRQRRFHVYCSSTPLHLLRQPAARATSRRRLKRNAWQPAEQRTAS